MTIKYHVGDLFEAIKLIDGTVVIPHICNNVGGWGAGFVVPLGRHFPESRKQYLEWCENEVVSPMELGEVQFVHCGNVVICNMIAQNGLMNSKNPKPINYEALTKCLSRVKHYLNGKGEIHTCAFGSGLAGGDWTVISILLEHFFPDANVYCLTEKDKKSLFRII
jgi:hypothetical protein